MARQEVERRGADNALNRARKAREITVDDLAEATGLKHRVVADWVARGVPPYVNKVVTLADALGVDVREILD